MVNKSRVLPLSAIIVLSLCHPLAALQIHDYEQALHLRFEPETFPSAPIPNESLWVGHHNFNGVGWSANDTRKGFALITPRHFVGANHFRPSINSQIRFFSTDGEVRSYTYEKFYNIKNTSNENTDIFIGELTENIPASHGIPLYPILDAPEAVLVGREIIVYGRGLSGPRVGRGVIGSFGNTFTGTNLNDTRNYIFQYSAATADQHDSYGELGDSGSPSFLPAEGMLTVSGIHSTAAVSSVMGTVTSATTSDSFILHYKDQINDHLAATGHRLFLTPLGETGLTITSVERNGDDIILHVENPAELPYDVHRTTGLDTGNWEIIATSETGPTWTGTIPPDADRAFWKLVRYPLPVSAAP